MLFDSILEEQLRRRRREDVVPRSVSEAEVGAGRLLVSGETQAREDTDTAISNVNKL